MDDNINKQGEEAVKVTVWSKKDCIQCDATKIVLQNRGINFIELELENQPEKIEEFRAAGYMAAPIVEAGNLTWSGFNLNHLNSIPNRL